MGFYLGNQKQEFGSEDDVDEKGARRSSELLLSTSEPKSFGESSENMNKKDAISKAFEGLARAANCNSVSLAFLTIIYFLKTKFIFRYFIEF